MRRGAHGSSVGQNPDVSAVMSLTTADGSITLLMARNDGELIVLVFSTANFRLLRRSLFVLAMQCLTPAALPHFLCTTRCIYSSVLFTVMQLCSSSPSYNAASENSRLSVYARLQRNTAVSQSWIVRVYMLCSSSDFVSHAFFSALILDCRECDSRF